MSKLAILKSLPTPVELRQSVQELRSLEQLPQLVSEEVMRCLAPLCQIQESLDRVMAIQRGAIEQMSEELVRRSSEQMAGQVQQMQSSVRQMAGQVQQMQERAAVLDRMPKNITSAASAAAQQMREEASILSQAASEARPSVWRTLGLMLGAAVIGALLVAAGQTGFERLLPPSDVQQRANTMAVIWSKATPEERELLKQIVNRPAN